MKIIDHTQSIQIKSISRLFILLMVFLVKTSYSQQVPRNSQYIMNEFLLNPAVSGVDGTTTMNLTGRMDWIGFDANVPTPKNYSYTIQTRLLKRHSSVKSSRSGNKLIKNRKGRVGIGGGVLNDYNGAFQRVGVFGTYAYHIFLNNSQFSFGFSGSITQLGIRDKYLVFKETGDRMEGLSHGTIWIPDFSAGINYMAPKFHIGFSTIQISESLMSFGTTDINLNSSHVNYNRIYLLLTSYTNILNQEKNWEYELSGYLKTNDKINGGLITQGDIMLRLIFEKTYWFGAGYRTTNDVIFLAGLKYNHMFLTYSFDYGTNEMSRNSYGSHELSLTLKFGETVRRLNWLDRY